MRKFYENSDRVQQSSFWEAIGDQPPAAGDTLECGYEFGTTYFSPSAVSASCEVRLRVCI